LQETEAFDSVWRNRAAAIYENLHFSTTSGEIAGDAELEQLI
jgi:hypothetical protein